MTSHASSIMHVKEVSVRRVQMMRTDYSNTVAFECGARKYRALSVLEPASKNGLSMVSICFIIRVVCGRYFPFVDSRYMNTNY